MVYQVTLTNASIASISCIMPNNKNRIDEVRHVHERALCYQKIEWLGRSREVGRRRLARCRE